MTLPAVEAGSPIRRIPVILLTGFLGSGKTTLLRKMLAHPGWSDAAVLINELGAVGLDHQLAWSASGSMLVLENGCICCSARDDLVNTLEELFWNRLQKKIPRFNRVIIETTGLADPGPIIKELFSHPLIAERYRLEAVVCTVDAVFGMQQLASHPESLAQAGSADMILLTKTDIADANAARLLEARLRQMNPLACVHAAGELRAAFMSGAMRQVEVEHRLRGEIDALNTNTTDDPEAPDAPEAGRYLFHRRVQSTVIHFTHPWKLDAFTRALQSALDLYGDRLLRIKGRIRIAGEERDAVVQAVQRMIFPFERIEAQAEGEAQNFIVCITLGVAAADLRRCFAGLSARAADAAEPAD
jgi:G3E family GTPase